MNKINCSRNTALMESLVVGDSSLAAAAIIDSQETEHGNTIETKQEWIH